ncbi:MAG: TonB-dependent receptor [Thermoanaerobaculia bacterium]|nr:TonB-dependent receptor [Thermoanaerobaculia bacterium]
MKYLQRLLVALCALLVSGAVFAQTTGSLTGRATQDGNPLPGVTVTAISPNLQGSRVTNTDVNGNFNMGALPPGEYTVKFEMEGLQTVTTRAQVGVSQTGRADADLKISALAEAITVTAGSSAVLETTEVQSNYKQQLVEDLPIQRTVLAQGNLAPNVTTNSPSVGQLVISGAPAHENLYMVNGAVINENLRGQIDNLFIEDAIQETTILTGAISAEYGRFTGGVINSITKSGGNQFSGSLRDSLTNPAWTGMSFDDQPDFTDEIISVYETTLGGRVIRDRLWFFLAGRYTKPTQDQFLYETNIPFQFQDEETRIEAKLTGQVTPRHSVSLSMLDLKNPESNFCFGACYELSSIDPQRELPNNFTALHYSGVFTNNLLGELNLSRKRFKFEGSGGENPDFATGTWGYVPSDFAFFGAPVFCGSCGAEERNNDYLDAKLTYYAASRGLGTHNIIGGYQNWAENRLSNNYQSASNFGVYVFSEQTPLSGPNDVFKPVLAPGDLITWWPIFEESQGSDFKTHSFYVNDRWELNDHWQFNLGVRYDKNDGKDAQGTPRTKDSLVSPRLGATYDVWGNGRLRLTGSYGQYAAKIAETIGGGATGAGTPAYVFYVYDGPEISGLPTVEALQQMYNWFQSVGGTDATDYIVFAQFPGVNVTINDGLKSPNVKEWSLGAGSQFGRGFARFDFISRDWSNFYSQKTLGTTVLDPFDQQSDLQEIYTTNDFFERTYRAATLQASYPLSERIQLGGNYTWSETKGNVLSETRDNGPVTESRFQYPEFRNFDRNAPTGFLPSDQTHKLRAWATLSMETGIGNFTFSALERFDSGTAYSAIGTVNYVSDPSLGYLPAATYARYANTPQAVNYFFSDRGELRFDDVQALDLSVNYRLRLGQAELFVSPEIINVFNENSVILGSTRVLTFDNDDTLAPFNPFTETPVEGIHYAKSSIFGQARNANDYQLARTYRVSFGVRF